MEAVVAEEEAVGGGGRFRLRLVIVLMLESMHVGGVSERT